MEQPPETAAPSDPAPRQSDLVQTFLPYRNQPALFGYYLAVFSLIPCLGLPLGAAAVFLGARGWRAAREHPDVRGKGHALVALVLGGLTLAANLAALLWVLLSISSWRGR